MTTETTPTEQTTQATPEPKTIADPNISFGDYEKLRRGEKLPESEPVSNSAPTEKTPQKEQKEAAASETAKPEETESEHEETEGEPKVEEKEKPGKKNGFQRRIDKLNAAKSAAQQEAEYWKREALKGATEPKKAPVESKATPAAGDGKPVAPSPDNFATWAEFSAANAKYVEDLADWKTDQKLNERDQKAEISRLETEQAKRTQTYAERAKAFTAKHADFGEVIDGVQASPIVNQAIIESEFGPELAYELAQKPEELDRINKLPPIAAAREMGKLEAKFAAAASSGTKQTTETKKTTSAPKPIEPLGGGKAQASKKTPEEMTFSEYEAYRRDQMKRRRA